MSLELKLDTLGAQTGNISFSITSPEGEKANCSGEGGEVIVGNDLYTAIVEAMNSSIVRHYSKIIGRRKRISVGLIKDAKIYDTGLEIAREMANRHEYWIGVRDVMGFEVEEDEEARLRGGEETWSDEIRVDYVFDKKNMPYAINVHVGGQEEVLKKLQVKMPDIFRTFKKYMQNKDIYSGGVKLIIEQNHVKGN